MFTPPATLVDAVRQRTLVPFVGAGISVGAVHGLAPELRFPSWPELIARLAGRLEAEQQQAHAAEVKAEPNALRAAQIAVDRLGRPLFLDEMRKAFDRRRAPVGADLSSAAAIWRLRAPFVLTTNYDAVLEWPWDPAEVQRVHNDDPTLLGTLDADAARRRVWHLHGSIDRVDTIILTTREYEKLYPAGTPKRLDYQNAFDRFKQLLATRPFLFLGYSLDEPLLRALLVDILDITGKTAPNKYLLLRAGQADAATQTALRHDYNVHVLEYEDFGPPLVAAIHAIGHEAWGDTLDVSTLRTTADMMALVTDLRTQLRGLAPRADVARLYNAARPAAWEHQLTGGDGVDLLDGAILRLAEAVAAGADQPPPLVDFVDRLRGESVEPWRTRLASWIDSALVRLTTDAASRARVKGWLASARSHPAAPGHVLVRISAGAPPGDDWLVHAWAWSGSRTPESVFGAEGAPYRRARQASWLSDLVDALEARRADPDQTTLAFLVPSRLALATIHQWQLPAEDRPRPAHRRHLHRDRSAPRAVVPCPSRAAPLRRQGVGRPDDARVGRARAALAGRRHPRRARRPRTARCVARVTGDLAAFLDKQGVRCVVLRDAPSAPAAARAWRRSPTRPLPSSCGARTARSAMPPKRSSARSSATGRWPSCRGACARRGPRRTAAAHRPSA
ncbi:MAG: SIR2 family protein [Vicinamibacterales bacterium]